MASNSTPAHDHIHLMQERIERQSAYIEELKRSGQDSAQAEQRLKLLRRALDEMRIQLGQLSTTELDAKRGGIAVALRMLSGKTGAA